MVHTGSLYNSIITYMRDVNRRNPGLFGKHRKKLIRDCTRGEFLKLIREPDNLFDQNAIKICNQQEQPLGYLSRYVAAKVAPLLDAGKTVEVKIREIHDIGKYYECLLEITAENTVWDKNRNPLDISRPDDLGLT